MAYAVAQKPLLNQHGWMDLPVAFYLDEKDYGYELHYVDVPVFDGAKYTGKTDKLGNPVNQEEYDLWVKSLPKKKQLNPFHTHFIHPEPDTITEDKIKTAMDFHLPNFYEAWKAGKTIRSGWDTNTRKAPTRYDKELSVEQFQVRQSLITQRINEFVVVQKNINLVGGKTFPATTIDVGAGAVNRGSTQGYGYMVFDKTNPANDTGILDTFIAWFSSNGSGFKVGTFSGSGFTFADRDYFTWGNIASGSAQTVTGQSVDVVLNDLIGGFWSGGNIERDSSGYAGVAVCSSPGDFFGAGDKTYNTLSGDAISLYATGDTGGWANISKINGITVGDIAKVNGIAVASISKINGVAV